MVRPLLFAKRMTGAERVRRHREKQRADAAALEERLATTKAVLDEARLINAELLREIADLKAENHRLRAAAGER